MLENGTANLVYTFIRSGATTSALTVNYTVGGTATLGTDYTGIAASPATKTVSFAAGSSTAIVTVDPTADSTVEADETVALTLAAGTGYTVGTTTPVTGTITNDDTPPMSVPFLVKDIFPGVNSSGPASLTAVGNTLYFTAYDGVKGYELWKSDGTAAGTTLVKDILPGASSSFPQNLTAVGNTLYFMANDGVNGYELWALNTVGG